MGCSLIEFERYQKCSRTAIYGKISTQKQKKKNLCAPKIIDYLFKF